MSSENNRNIVLKGAFVKVLSSLGSAIEKTIMWHMNIRGIFTNPTFIKISSLNESLGELMGPASDEILGMVWEDLTKYHNAKYAGNSKQAVNKISDWLGQGGSS